MTAPAKDQLHKQAAEAYAVVAQHLQCKLQQALQVACQRTGTDVA
jgi:hypothetical protein